MSRDRPTQDLGSPDVGPDEMGALTPEAQELELWLRSHADELPLASATVDLLLDLGGDVSGVRGGSPEELEAARASNPRREQCGHQHGGWGDASVSSGASANGARGRSAGTGRCRDSPETH